MYVRAEERRCKGVSVVCRAGFLSSEQLLGCYVETEYRLCSNYSTAPIIEPAMDFDFLFVLFMNHFKFGIIFLWCLANKNEFTK